MSKKQNIFVRSLHELKSTRCIAVTALLIAINITLDLLGLTIKLPPNLRIGFGFLCNAAIGMLFGPVVGMMAGVCTDVLGYFAGNLSMGAYFPGYTLTAVVGGLIWGLWLYPRKITVWRAIGAKACINVFCNICLNTLWLTITGGKVTNVAIDASGETPALGGKAAESLAPALVEAGGTAGVDAVTGSTMTSDAVFEAMEDCLTQAAQ